MKHACVSALLVLSMSIAVSDVVRYFDEMLVFFFFFPKGDASW